MSLFDIIAMTVIAFMGGIVLGLLLLLRHGAKVTSRPLRALRRLLLGRSWQPVLMEPVDVRKRDTRLAPRRSPSRAAP